MKKERLSYSALSQFGKSPNHLLDYWQDDMERTPAMMFGSLVHKKILEPDKFSSEYAVFEGTRRGKVWESFKEENTEKEIVTVTEYNTALKVVNKASENKLFSDLLMQTTETEKHIEWSCDGVKYHGYVDMIGKGFIADIKTCADGGERFARDLKYNDYKMQAAMYLTGFDASLKYYIIAIEKSSPYNVAVYELSEELLSKGYSKYRYLNKKYIEWDGKPCSYSDKIIKVGEPELFVPENEINI